VWQGFAKVVEWSANMMEEDAKRKLKAAELQAKKDRLKIWTTYVPPQTNSTAILDVNFSGKVRVGQNCGRPSFSWVADGWGGPCVQSHCVDLELG
jgi:hypothetical protein